MSTNKTPQIVKYKDFDLNFTAHPVSGDVSVLSHENSVKQALKNILRMNFYEIPFQPSIGSGIPSLLFEPANFTTVADAKERVRSAVRAYDSRVEIIRIDASIKESENALNIRVEYYIVNDPRSQSLDITVSRNR